MSGSAAQSAGASRELLLLVGKLEGRLDAIEKAEAQRGRQHGEVMRQLDAIQSRLDSRDGELRGGWRVLLVLGGLVTGAATALGAFVAKIW